MPFEPSRWPESFFPMTGMSERPPAFGSIGASGASGAFGAVPLHCSCFSCQRHRFWAFRIAFSITFLGSVSFLSIPPVSPTLPVSPMRTLHRPSPSDRLEPRARTSRAEMLRTSSAAFLCSAHQRSGRPSRVSPSSSTVPCRMQARARSSSRRWSFFAVPVSSSMDRETTSCTASRFDSLPTAPSEKETKLASEKETSRARPTDPNSAPTNLRQLLSPESPSSASATTKACSRMAPVSTVPRTTGRSRPSFSTAASTPPATPVPVDTPQSERKTMVTSRGAGESGDPVSGSAAVPVLIPGPPGWLRARSRRRGRGRGTGCAGSCRGGGRSAP